MFNNSKNKIAKIKKLLRLRTRGFTLIETFVAVTILVTSIMGPLSIASQGLYTALVASDQTTALFLAQDSMEYIQWVRNTNRLSGVDWMTYLSSCISTDGSKSCRFDSTMTPSTNGNIVQCIGTCPVLNYDTSSSFYNYNLASGSNAPSKFTRTVSLVTPVCAGAVCNSNEVQVTSVVSWQTGKSNRSFTLREDILNWQ